jgi:hypothetical protein
MIIPQALAVAATHRQKGASGLKGPGGCWGRPARPLF